MISDNANVMLIVSGDTSIQNAGEIFLRSLCKIKCGVQFSRFSIIDKKSKSLPEDWLGFPVRFLSISRMRRVPYVGRFLNRWLHFPVVLMRQLYVKLIFSRKVLSFIRQENARLLWFVLNSSEIIALAESVSRKAKVPFVVTVWDPPERAAYFLNYDVYSKYFLLKDFGRVLKKASRLALASENMVNEYAIRYGIQAVPFIQGVPSTLKQQPVPRPLKKDELTIGFAGSLYARKTWDALVSALDAVNWVIAGRAVRIVYCGKQFAEQAQSARHICFMGWRNVSEVIKIFKSVDLAYVPYIFDEKETLWGRLCFPNKIPIYLASGCPLFAHAPSGSSPVEFLKKYNCGIACNSIEGGEIVSALEKFSNKGINEKELSQEIERAFSESLGMQRFIEDFYFLLGLSKSTLKKENIEVIEKEFLKFI